MMWTNPNYRQFTAETIDQLTLDTIEEFQRVGFEIAVDEWLLIINNLSIKRFDALPVWEGRKEMHRLIYADRRLEPGMADDVRHNLWQIIARDLLIDALASYKSSHMG